MLIPAAAALVAVFMAFVTPAFAHEGHDHGPKPAEVSVSAAPRTDSVSALFELVAVVARDGGLDIWLDSFAENAPVEGAAIEAETPSGTIIATPAGTGLFRLTAPWTATPGAHDLIFTVTQGTTVDILTATLVIPDVPANPNQTGAGPSPIGPALSQGAGRLPDGGTMPALLVAGLGFLAGLLVMGLVARRKAQSMRAAGVMVFLVLVTALPALAQPIGTPGPHIRDQAVRLPDGSVFVPKSAQRILGIRTAVANAARHPRILELPGRIIPDPDASGVVVAAVAGRLVAPPAGFPRLGTVVKAGEVLARVQPSLQAIDASDVQQSAGELDQQIAAVRRRLERIQAIPDAVTRAQIEDTRIELTGLQDRRRRLDTVRRTAEALVSPVAGVVAATYAVAGQIAEPNAVIFRIADPGRLWVEALSHDTVPVAEDATARLPDGRSLELVWRGAGLVAVQQAIPVHFAIQGDTARLRAGQPVTVLATTAEAQDGIAVPRASVLRGTNGQNLIWEHVAAERFVPREVRTEPLDGTRVLVPAGLEPGQRVVTQGAELLNQVR
jgi:membrane fusion protein, heavy metal efflux system